VIVTSRKRAKLARRMANEVGVQRAKAVKAAKDRAEVVLQSINDGWTVGEPRQEDRAWRCDLTLTKEGRNAGKWFCNHNHKSPETARACAEREAKRRNKVEVWTEEKVRNLVKEVTAKG